jgi:hypothetical protein
LDGTSRHRADERASAVDARSIHARKEAAMPKIKLELDALRVESFETETLDAGVGTVHGQQEVTEEGDAAAALPTDWKTCQGAECTARTLCLYSCIESPC